MELDHESVYRLDPESDGSYSMSRVTFDTLSPNGLVFSPDQTTLYVAEAPSAPRGQRELRAYPVQATAVSVSQRYCTTLARIVASTG
jgi:sugar lactone lactonase YvrE